MNTSQLLLALDQQRKNLAANLSQKGVAAQEIEGLQTLVPKVLNISGSSAGGGDSSGDYDYILLRAGGIDGYFEVNLYDYMDDLNDIEFIGYQFVNSLAYIGIWSKQLEKTLYPLTGEDKTFHKANVYSDVGMLDMAWAGLMVPTQKHAYQPFVEVVAQISKNLGTNILGYTNGKLYPVNGMSIYNGVPKWDNTLYKTSPSVNTEQKLLIIAYKKQKGSV